MPTTAETRLFWDQHADVWHYRGRVIHQHLALYGRPGIEALDLQVGERVLDVGCGPGYCAGDLADLVGDSGQVVGVDLAPAMIALAQKISSPDRENVSFHVADAQTAVLGPVKFDAAYARFSLLFEDPHAGLLNIRRALGAGGRFACLTWGPRQHNPWMHVPQLGASRVLGIEPPSINSDHDLPAATAELAMMLHQAGFMDVVVKAITGARDIPVEAVNDHISILFEEGGGHGSTWAATTTKTRDAACEAAIEAMAAFRTHQGWSLPGCALLGIGVNRT